MAKIVPDVVVPSDPQLEHLKIMASVMRTIEGLTVGTTLTVTPNPGGGWRFTRSVDEEIYVIDRAMSHIPPSPPEPLAAALIEAEIEKREGRRTI